MSINPKLYLIPTPIGEQNPKGVLPHETLIQLPNIKHFLVENLRSARRFLKAAGYPHDFDDVWFYEINEHNQHEVSIDWLQPLREGNDTGLLSEAGVPCVADPGYTMVRLAHENNVEVISLGGPSSIIKALMASGLNGQQFTFHGYLPVKPDELKPRLKKIEELARKNYTQIFIETPYRNDRMFDIITTTCHSDTLLCIASAIDTDQQKIVTKAVEFWKKNKPELKGKPCVFLLGY